MTDETTELLDRLKATVLDSATLENTLTIDQESVTVSDAGSDYALTIEEFDGQTSIGSFKIDDTVILVYKAASITQNNVQVVSTTQGTKGLPWPETVEATNRRLTDNDTFEVKPIEYKFNEGEILDEVRRYIDSTYSGHYAGKLQATDAIIATGHGLGFGVGNIMKYAWRLGKKGGFNLDDLMKVIHYSVITIYVIKNGANK